MAARNSIIRSISFILIVAVFCPFGYGRIIYVDDDAAGANVGSSWVDAIDSLQDALLLAYFYEKPVEIRVAAGIYTPDKGIGIMRGDREASFQLIDGVTIKGGYAGLSHRSPGDLRDIALYETILSGDLEQNDDNHSTGIADNSYHVVTSFRTDQTTVLDGVTISAGGNTSLAGRTGRSTISEENIGGGMYNNYGSPMLINCTFTGNRGRSGAAVYNDSGSPSFIGCTFSNNSADENGGAMYNDSSNPGLLNCTFVENSAFDNGGGMYNDNSNATLTNCTFSDNSARYGGGLCNNNSEPMLADCVFINNSASRGGGAVCNYGGESTFLSCTFKENLAGREGGGILNDRYSRINLTNCLFSRNSARYGGAINNNNSTFGWIYSDISDMEYNSSAMLVLNCTFNGNFAEYGGGAISSGSFYGYGDINEGITFYDQVTLINCILWGDTPDEIRSDSLYAWMEEPIGVFYSNVQGGFPGQGNIDMNPLFADPNNDDYHLKSAAGRWTSASSVEPDPETQSWVIDEVSSPCIDSGDPDVPVGLERFPNGGIINMGAYGGTPQASLTPPDLPTIYTKAYNPYPADDVDNVEEDVILSWTAGLNAAYHDVYFGTDRDNVANAHTSDTTGVYRGRQDGTSFNPSDGTGLSDGTYYWRVDEVGGEGKIIKGEVWSFYIGGPQKGRACFTGETPVWIDGKLVPISKTAASQIVSGIAGRNKIDTVQAHNGTFTCYDILLDSGKTITVAENHYFMTNSGRWLSLHNLRIGMKLKTSKGTIGIKSITKKSEPYFGKVYNLKVEGSDRYLIGEDAVVVRDY